MNKFKRQGFLLLVLCLLLVGIPALAQEATPEIVPEVTPEATPFDLPAETGQVIDDFSNLTQELTETVIEETRPIYYDSVNKIIGMAILAFASLVAIVLRFIREIRESVPEWMRPAVSDMIQAGGKMLQDAAGATKFTKADDVVVNELVKRVKQELQKP